MDKKFKINAILGMIFVLTTSVLGIWKNNIVINIVEPVKGDSNGYYNALLSLMILFNLVALGIEQVLNSKISTYYFSKDYENFTKYYSMAQKIYNRITIWSLGLLIILTFSLPMWNVKYLYDNSLYKSWIYIFSVFLPSSLFFYKSNYLIILFCKREIYKLELLNFLRNLAMFISIFIAVKLYNSMLIAVIISSILILIVDFGLKFQTYYKYKDELVTVETEVDKELYTNSKYTAALSIISKLGSAARLQILYYFFPKSMTSNYTSINLFINALTLIFINTILNTSYNKLIELHSVNKKEFVKSFDIQSILSHFVNIAIYIPVIIFFPSFLRLTGWFPKKLDISVMVYWFAIDAYMWWNMLRFNHIAYIQQKFKELLPAYIIALPIYLITSSLCAKYIGPFGVLIGSTTQWALLYLYFSHKFSNVFKKELLRTFRDIFIVVIVVLFSNKFIISSTIYNSKTFIDYFLNNTLKGVLIEIGVVILYIILEPGLYKMIKRYKK